MSLYFWPLYYPYVITKTIEMKNPNGVSEKIGVNGANVWMV